MLDSKYMVFKKDEWADWVARMEPGESSIFLSSCPNPLEDLTVIRHQDLFAGPALWSYAHGINLVLKGLKPLAEQTGGGHLANDLPHQLRSVADYFASAAQNADELGFKFPD